MTDHHTVSFHRAERPRLPLAALVAGAALLLPSLNADTITQSVNSTSDSIINWMGPIWGSPTAAAPTAGNDYVSDGSITSTLRTGSSASGITFSGDSLTLRNGVNFIVKRNANANYIAESGAIFQAGANDKAVNGTILVASGQSTIFTSGTNSFTFNALISGSGTISIQGSGSGNTLITNLNNTFSGDWIVQSGTLASATSGSLDNTGAFSVTGGTLDIGYAFNGTATDLSLSGTGLFDLGNGFNHTFASVSIGGTSLANGTYGYADLSASQQAFFVNGSDTFTVVGATIPEPSVCALLGGIGTLLFTTLRRRKPALASA